MDLVNDFLLNTDTLIISLLSAVGFIFGNKYKDNLLVRFGLMLVLFLFKILIHSRKHKHPHLKPVIEKIHNELIALKSFSNNKLNNRGVA